MLETRSLPIVRSLRFDVSIPADKQARMRHTALARSVSYLPECHQTIHPQTLKCNHHYLT